MADTVREINTIADIVASASPFTRIWKQFLPLVYKDGEIAIRWQGDRDTSETNTFYRINRDYQIVYFASSEAKCLGVASEIRCTLAQTIKTEIEDTGDYMTLGPFSFSQPFKTDTDGVFSVVAILQVEVREGRLKPVFEKMAEIDVDSNGENYVINELGITRTENGGGI